MSLLGSRKYYSSLSYLSEDNIHLLINLLDKCYETHLLFGEDVRLWRRDISLRTLEISFRQSLRYCHLALACML
jgi:hypothetical protein